MGDRDFNIVPYDANGTARGDLAFTTPESDHIMQGMLAKVKNDLTSRSVIPRTVSHIPLNRTTAADLHVIGYKVPSFCGADWEPTNIEAENVTADWGDLNCCPECLSERFGRPVEYYKKKYFPTPWLEGMVRVEYND